MVIKLQPASRGAFAGGYGALRGEKSNGGGFFGGSFGACQVFTIFIKRRERGAIINLNFPLPMLLAFRKSADTGQGFTG